MDHGKNVYEKRAKDERIHVDILAYATKRVNLLSD